ncbi:MAG: hypothetical protein POELPBGB_00493 [Bacteroidia bacterium]|nr:hypothetical protein [Bacteroidia bacterium]
MKYFILFGITTIVFFSIDILWLGVIAKNFYREKLGFILSNEVNWAAAIVFYLIYIAGILYLAVVPALLEAEWEKALLNGAILGFLCYATYDLTNMATIARWPLQIVIIDIVWGTVLTGSVSVLSYLLAEKFMQWN